jgi:hypothetical protein
MWIERSNFERKAGNCGCKKFEINKVTDELG